MLTIVTWNVNSIRARLDLVLSWLREAAPDLVLLQELKCAEEAFPLLELQSLGYRVEICGQKGYNGVAILSRLPLSLIRRGLPGDESDAQARYIEALADDGSSSGLRVGCLYLPNGNPVESGKFSYKLAWMERLCIHAKSLLSTNEPVVLGGDFNVCPSDGDVYDPRGWANDALCRHETRTRFRAILNLGYVDAIAVLDPGPGRYSFWDYQAGAWENDHGLRIDHFLLSPAAADRLQGTAVHRALRGGDRPSDHVPVAVSLREIEKFGF